MKLLPVLIGFGIGQIICEITNVTPNVDGLDAFYGAIFMFVAALIMYRRKPNGYLGRP